MSREGERPVGREGDGEKLGHVEFSPDDPVTAGSLGTWAVRFTVGERGIDPGGAIALARRWPCDWGVPQGDRPSDPDYVTVVSSGRASLAWQFVRREAWHPWDHVFRVTVSGSPLRKDDVLTITFGDRSRGGPGARAQTCIEEACRLSVRVDPDGGGTWTEVAAPAVAIVGGPVDRLVAVAPSTVAVGEEFRLLIRAEDAWGNPAHGYEGTLHIGDPIGGKLEMPRSVGGVTLVMVRLDAAGIYRLEISDPARGLLAVSNPVECHEVRPSFRVFWGDLHAQCLIGCGARSLSDYLRHARNVAGLDFASHQANDCVVSNPEWAETQETIRRFHEPHRFVTLLGVEWSGETPVGGDRNLYFLEDEAPIRRSSHRYVQERSNLSEDLPTLREVYAHYRGTRTLMIPHVGGRMANLEYFDASLEHLIEIHSMHATSEWLLLEALRRGLRVGVTGGSDGVEGRPGTSHPGSLRVRNVRGGLVAVHMPALTREALWAALHARRCYATTGERILLGVEADGHPMGEAYAADGPPTLRIQVHGTNPLDAVEIFRGAERIFEAPLESQRDCRRDLIRIAWRGARGPGNFEQARLVWDGEVTLEGGRFLGATGHAFDSPAEGIRSVDASRVTWRSLTAGDRDGVVLHVDAADAAVFTFRTPPATFRFTLAELIHGPKTVEASAPGSCVTVRCQPANPRPWSWEGAHRDEGVVPGVNAYWVRVTQDDGNQAWSSPIFATVSAG